MMLSYLPRLACVAFACFFLVHLVTTLILTLNVRRAIRMASAYPPVRAARFLLTIRLLPLAFSAFVTLGLCIPSYLWFEAEPFEEPVGLACLLMAAVGLASCGFACAQALRAGFRSFLFARRCRRAGRPILATDPYPPALVLAGSAPFLALTGIVRPRVVVSEAILNALPEEELSMVFRHESAHRRSHDNLKRLCFLIAHGMMPVPGNCRELERRWMTFAEYAADDEAVDGDSKRSLALASALVRVARFGAGRATSAVAASYFADACDLSARVDRLLAAVPAHTSRPRKSHFGAASMFLAAGCVASAMLEPATFRFVQSILEDLIR
jgi:hypothetical protein